jgi:nucleoid-associated protein YgaU
LPVQEPLLPSADDPAAIENEKPSPLWRRHRIVEGDTLSALAERYLGDGARAGEIHVANMDRLASPEILPLGVTLLIPPRIPQSTAQNYQP